MTQRLVPTNADTAAAGHSLDDARRALLDARPVLLPFNPADLLATRVKPAAFAKICGVSRQSVSQWIRKGWITRAPDGLIDPVAATRQLLRRTDPSRLRARVLREATASLGELHARIRNLADELHQERARGDSRETAGQNRAADDAAARFQRFTAALLDRFEDAQRAHAAGVLDAWLDELGAVEFFGVSLADYRDAIGADDGP